MSVRERVEFRRIVDGLKWCSTSHEGGRVTSLRIPTGMYNALRELARAQGLRVSDIIRLLIYNYLKENGYDIDIDECKVEKVKPVQPKVIRILS